MTSKVNGKTGILTPCRSETPENFITKIGHTVWNATPATSCKARQMISDQTTCLTNAAWSTGVYVVISMSGHINSCQLSFSTWMGKWTRENYPNWSPGRKTPSRRRKSGRTATAWRTGNLFCAVRCVSCQENMV